MYMFFHDFEAGVDEFNGYCNGCHQGLDDGAPTFPRSTPQEFHDFLLSATASHCMDYTLVVPGEPEESAIALILETKCGGEVRMPPTFPLYPEEIAGVKSWIAAGAKP
jgi:hypothetical protein